MNTASNKLEQDDLDSEILIEFIKLLHGSYESKPNIVSKFKIKYPNCKKATLERKIKEFC